MRTRPEIAVACGGLAGSEAAWQLAELVCSNRFKSTAHAFDAVPYFDGCMPVEEMAGAAA